MRIAPIPLAVANAFVAARHRHHGPTVGHRFSVGLLVDDRLVGVAIMGRPVARMADDGWTLEVLRLCTDGTPNACSKLYGACRNTARALGYTSIVTYTLLGEQGASLRASGWVEEAQIDGHGWNMPGRTRDVTQTVGVPKRRWRATLNPPCAWHPAAPAEGSGQLPLLGGPGWCAAMVRALEM